MSTALIHLVILFAKPGYMNSKDMSNTIQNVLEMFQASPRWPSLLPLADKILNPLMLKTRGLTLKSLRGITL